MSAAYDGDIDEPIAYSPTAAGWSISEERTILTVQEGALLARVHCTHLCQLARSGAVSASKINGRWLIERDSLESYLSTGDGPRGAEARRRLPAVPLLRRIELAGGASACGVEQRSADEKALERARQTGTVTAWMADRLAVRLLGLTLWDLWSDIT